MQTLKATNKERVFSFLGSVILSNLRLSFVIYNVKIFDLISNEIYTRITIKSAYYELLGYKFLTK